MVLLAADFFPRVYMQKLMIYSFADFLRNKFQFYLQNNILDGENVMLLEKRVVFRIGTQSQWGSISIG